MTDTWDSHIIVGSDKIMNGMYYYLLKPTDIGTNSEFLGNCPSIISCWYSPILDENMLNTDLVDYDVERFGKLNNGTLETKPKLNRIKSIKDIKKELGKINVYNKWDRQQFKDYRNESRLQNFPYCYGMIVDFFNVPYEFKFHEQLIINNQIKIMSKAFLSDKGTYSIYLEGNKNDTNGILEYNLNTAPLDIPVGSSAYSNWSSTQKAQDNYHTRSAIMNANFSVNASDMTTNLNNQQNLVNGGLGVLGGALNLQFGSALMSGVNSYQSTQRNNLSNQITKMQSNLSKVQAIGTKNAMQKDLSNTPRSMISTGSDVGFQIANGRKEILYVKYTISEEYRDRLTDYFTMYGYKQSKMMNIDVRSRQDFNYVKTIGINIKSKVGVSIPMIHLQKLKTIYDNGLTIWHIDRNGNKFLNYNYDNIEMRLNSK